MHYHVVDTRRNVYEGHSIPGTYPTFAWALARACVLTAQRTAPVGAYKPIRCEENHDEAQ